MDFDNTVHTIGVQSRDAIINPASSNWLFLTASQITTWYAPLLFNGLWAVFEPLIRLQLWNRHKHVDVKDYSNVIEEE